MLELQCSHRLVVLLQIDLIPDAGRHLKKCLRTEGIKVMPRRQTSEKFFQYN